MSVFCVQFTVPYILCYPVVERDTLTIQSASSKTLIWRGDCKNFSDEFKKRVFIHHVFSQGEEIANRWTTSLSGARSHRMNWQATNDEDHSKDHFVHGYGQITAIKM